MGIRMASASLRLSRSGYPTVGISRRSDLYVYRLFRLSHFSPLRSAPVKKGNPPGEPQKTVTLQSDNCANHTCNYVCSSLVGMHYCCRQSKRLSRLLKKQAPIDLLPSKALQSGKAFQTESVWLPASNTRYPS